MHRIIKSLAFTLLLLLPALALAAGEPGETGGQAADGSAAVLTGQDQGQEEQGAEPEEAPAAEEQPSTPYLLAPSLDTYLGARIIDLSTGSRRAAQYDFLHDRPQAGFKLDYMPLPQRLDAEFSFVDEMKHHAELSYAYKDILVLEYLSSGLWHNLDHLRFKEGAINGIPAPLDRDPNAEYGVVVNDNWLRLRLKWPEYAYHAFIELRDYNREGDIQQRFLLGDIATGQKIAETRNIEWDTQTLKVGVNGHLGPAELEYQHGIKAFDPAGQVHLMDAYPASAAAPARPAGDYVHNVVPRLEREWNTIRAHTSYTGRIVGNISYTQGTKRNMNNSTHANFYHGATNWSLIPAENFTVKLLYRHDGLDVRNPESVAEKNFATSPPSVSRILPVAKHSISSNMDTAEVAVKYSPLPNLYVKADYKFVNTDRGYTGDWAEPVVGLRIPDETNLQTARLSAWSRPVRQVDLRASITYSYSPDPAYPTSFRNSICGDFKGNWAVSPGLNLNVSYKGTREENPFNIPGQDTDRDRHVARDTAGANLLWMPLDWVSTTAYYNYQRTKTTVTMTFQTSPPTGSGINSQNFFEHAVPNRDSSHVYGLSADTAFSGPLNFSADFHQSFSRGRFFLTEVFTGTGGFVYDTTDIPGFTDLSVRETGGSLTARYEFPKGWSGTLCYDINNYVDVEHKVQDGSQTGTAQAVTMLVSKKW